MSIFEFRGVDNLVYAELTTDDNETDGGYITGEVKTLSVVATISKEVETSSDTHYYDNQPMIVVSSEGEDKITLTVAPLEVEKLCEINGKPFDEETGMMVDGESTAKYFALGYRTKGTDGKHRYIWRLKGQFSIPKEEAETESKDVKTSNTELTYTGISTTHKFKKGKLNKDKTWAAAGAKGIMLDERVSKVDLKNFFATVNTPDTIKPPTPPTV